MCSYTHNGGHSYFFSIQLPYNNGDGNYRRNSDAVCCHPMQTTLITYCSPLHPSESHIEEVQRIKGNVQCIHVPKSKWGGGASSLSPLFHSCSPTFPLQYPTVLPISFAALYPFPTFPESWSPLLSVNPAANLRGSSSCVTPRSSY